MAGWTIYSQLLSKDPLMEAFYKISGGKDRFEALPEINLEHSPDGKILTTIGRIQWDSLNHPISRAKTLDGRNVIIIKGLSRDEPDSQIKCLFACIERTSLEEVTDFTAISALARSVMQSLFEPFKGNDFGGYKSYSYSPNSREGTEILSSITSEMANDFYTQLAQARNAAVN